MHLPFVFVSERPEPESALFRRMPLLSLVSCISALDNSCMTAVFCCCNVAAPDLIELDVPLILPFRKLTVVLRSKLSITVKIFTYPCRNCSPHSFFAHLTGDSVLKLLPAVCQPDFPIIQFCSRICDFRICICELRYLLPDAHLPVLQQHRKQLHRNGLLTFFPDFFFNLFFDSIYLILIFFRKTERFFAPQHSVQWQNILHCPVHQK